MNTVRLLLLVAILCASPLPALAEQLASEANARPGINEKYLSPSLDVETWIERFEGESRQIFRAKGEIIAALSHVSFVMGLGSSCSHALLV